MLSVLHVAYALAPPLGPAAPGGAEQVLSRLEAASSAAGLLTGVVAPEGSRVSGRLFPFSTGRAPYGAEEQERAVRACAAATARALEAERWDVLHLHGLAPHRVLPAACPPAIVTLHLPASFYPAGALTARRGVHFVCVSHAQAREMPTPLRAIAAVVPNGVPLDAFDPSCRKERFAVVLARICPEKGIAAALDAARVAGIPLLVAGVALPYPEHLRYLEEEVRPRLDRARRLVGPVGKWGRRRLLARARCLVVASLAPETSSLAAMEALASGTPVVARRIGALPEVVEDGVTGFLVGSDAELADAMREAPRLSSTACRRAAEERFDARVMASRYHALYWRVAAGPVNEPREPRP